MLHHPFVDRTPNRTPQRRDTAPRNGIGGRAQTHIHRIADGTSGIGEHPGQIEAITDAQCRTDLVGELSQQLVAFPPGDTM